MKIAIDFLNRELEMAENNCSEYKESLDVGIKENKYNPKMFTLESIEILTGKLMVFQEERQDIWLAIDDLKALAAEHESLKTALTNLMQHYETHHQLLTWDIDIARKALKIIHP